MRAASNRSIASRRARARACASELSAFSCSAQVAADSADDRSPDCLRATDRLLACSGLGSASNRHPNRRAASRNRCWATAERASASHAASVARRCFAIIGKRVAGERAHRRHARFRSRRREPRVDSQHGRRSGGDPEDSPPGHPIPITVSVGCTDSARADRRSTPRGGRGRDSTRANFAGRCGALRVLAIARCRRCPGLLAGGRAGSRCSGGAGAARRRGWRPASATFAQSRALGAAVAAAAVSSRLTTVPARRMRRPALVRVPRTARPTPSNTIAAAAAQARTLLDQKVRANAGSASVAREREARLNEAGSIAGDSSDDDSSGPSAP